jgi:signal transduction histidine kinase
MCKRPLADTLTSSEDLKHIIENLDLLGQTLAGAQNHARRVFAIGPLTQDIVGRCAAFASSHGVKVQARVAEAGALAQVQSVPELYERALTNVLRNSIAHSPQGSEVSVILQPRETDVRVAVRDRGTPLDRTQPTRMFEAAGQIAAKTELVGRYSRGLGLMSAKLAAVAAGLELGIAPAEDGYANVFQLVFNRV